MHISYRMRHALRNTGIVLLILGLAALLVYLIWFTWIGRYVVYTRDQGAVLNMELDPEVPMGNLAVQPNPRPISIYYSSGEDADRDATELTQMVGYYADAELLADMDLVMAQISLLEPGTPVMLDVKDGKGRFFYGSHLSTDRRASINPEDMDALIRELDARGMYLIARLPAFRDYAFGLNSTENGLFVASGSHLWADSDYCYWLDPTKQGTITYLMNIISELKGLGFDEVVFDNFCFPDTTNMLFSGDQVEALNAAAATLVSGCTDRSFAVSFIASQEGFRSPGGRSRMYYTDVAAIQAATVAQQSGLAEPSVYVVFLTNVHDTRFNEYSVLRPLDSAG